MRELTKKITMLSLIILVMLCIAINISSNIMWGYDTTRGSDEFRHFARARQIAYHNIQINKMWDDPQIYDLYPPGFHVFVASFMILTDNYDAFFISIVYRILFSMIISLTIFLIGKKVNYLVGLLSVFFYNTFFFISANVGRVGAISYIHPYVHLVSRQSYLATYLITHEMVFISILLYLLFMKSNSKNEIKIGAVFLLVGAVHGISHISTFIGFVVNFIGFLLIAILISLPKNKYAVIKNIKILLITTLALPLTYFFYYYPMTPEVLTSKYNLSHFLPKILPNFVINRFTEIFLTVTIFSTLAIAIIYLFQNYWKKSALSTEFFSLSKKYVFIFIPLYIILYLSIILLVTDNPQNYRFSVYQLINGIFPTYFPSLYNYLSLYSLIIGFGMYILTIISIFFSLKSSHRIVLHILMMYLAFYMIWWLFAVPIHYYADRIIYFMYVLPFIYALGTYYFLKKINIFKTHKTIDKQFKYLIVSIFLILILLTNITTQVNSDPLIRDKMDISNPLRIGVNNAPVITGTLSTVVNQYIYKNEYVLTSMLVGEALAGTTHIRPPTLMYNTIVKDHKNVTLRRRAFFGSDEYREKFFEQYNARYLIVGVMDVTTGGEIPGQLAPINRYNNSPHLILIYAKGDGERIYMWVN